MSALLQDAPPPDVDSDSEEEFSLDGEPVQLGFLEEPVPDRPLVSRYFPSKCGGRPVRGVAERPAAPHSQCTCISVTVCFYLSNDIFPWNFRLGCNLAICLESKPSRVQCASDK